MTYAVTVSTDDGPAHAGSLELEHDGVRFSGRGALRYADLGDVYLERRRGESLSVRPTLVLVSHTGERLRISSLEGLGALHELAEELVEHRGKPEA